MFIAFLILLVAVIFSVAGELLLKNGMNQVGLLSLRPDAFLGTMLRVLTTPSILVGFVCVGIAAVFWLSVLSRAPLSWAYPMLSLSYVLGVFAAAIFLKEPLNLSRILGVLIIVSGVALVYRSG